MGCWGSGGAPGIGLAGPARSPVGRGSGPGRSGCDGRPERAEECGVPGRRRPETRGGSVTERPRPTWTPPTHTSPSTQPDWMGEGTPERPHTDLIVRSPAHTPCNPPSTSSVVPGDPYKEWIGPPITSYSCLQVYSCQHTPYNLIVSPAHTPHAIWLYDLLLCTYTVQSPCRSAISCVVLQTSMMEA